jgi:DNA-binding GntR family transcriptional regulator
MKPNQAKAHYMRAADEIRRRVTEGIYPPGRSMPSQRVLARELSTNREVIVDAFRILVNEGVVRATGSGYFVPPPPNRKPVTLQRGASVTCRMPTPEERMTRAIDLGVPVMVVSTGGPHGVEDLYPADRYEIRAAE